MSEHNMPPGFGDDDPTAPERCENLYATVDIRAGEVRAGGESDTRAALVFEPTGEGRGALLAGETAIRLVFRAGVPHAEASRLSRELHQYVEAITYQRFIT